MNNHFVKLSDLQSLDELVSRSNQQPVVVFKHSTTCPISAAAYQEMTDFEGEVTLVEVQSARELSLEIEHLTGVAHESPQVIVLRKGQVVWSASHRNVKADAVADAVREAA